MADETVPDVRTQLKRLVWSMRVASFPATLWRCADALAPTFVPTRSGAARTREVLAKFATDVTLQHWLCQGAEVQELVYCRMGLHLLGDLIDGADEERLRSVAMRLMMRPTLGEAVALGLDIAERGLKTH
jgi:hypothetical protein